ncbi:hypothetical protein OY671_012890, partial [Metschnikowia pulcherrima]
MTAKVSSPDSDNVNNAFAAIVQAGSPEGIRGSVIAAASAAMMSTASAAMSASATVSSEDSSPASRGGRGFTHVRSHRSVTSSVGSATLGIASAVDDVLNASTCAYNSSVGGMSVPISGAIWWRRATTPGAIASMSSGCGTAIGFM